MDRPQPQSSSQDELTHASLALAQFFDGIVITDEELDWAGDPAPVNQAVLADVAALEPNSEPLIPAGDCPLLLTATDLDQDAPLRVSLNQLRQWYAVARMLRRSDRLVRIAQLGSQFKQMFGEANPDLPRPFTAWSEKEVEWWLADLAAYNQQEQPAILIQ